MEDSNESRVRYRDIVDNSLIGIFQSNLKGEVLFVNDTLVKLLEYDSPQDMMARWTHEFYRNPADQIALLQALKKEGRVSQFAAEVVSGKGNSRFIMINVTLRGDIIYGVVIDVTEKTRAEDALLESEEKYRELVDNSPSGIFQSNIKGELIFANHALVKMFEYKSPEDMMSGDVFKFYKNPADRKPMMRGLRKEKKINDVLIEMITKKENTRFVHFSATLREDVLTGTVIDITERYLAEKELSRIRTHLQHVIACSPAVIYSCSINSRGKNKPGYSPTFISDNLKQLFGYKVEECLGDKKWWSTHIHPEDRPGAIENMKRLFEDGHLAHEYRIRHKDGNYLWIRDELVLVKGVDGETEEFVGSWSDISKWKETEIALQESMDKWRSLVESSPDYVMLIGPDLKVQFINKTLPNVKAEDVIGQLVYKMAQKKNQSRLRNILQEVLATGETVDYDSVHIAPDRQEYYTESRIAPVKIDDEVVSLIMSSRDVTDHQKADMALRESEEQWRSLTVNSPDHILLLNKDFVIEYLNFAAPGLKVEEIVGTAAYSHYPREKQPEVKRVFQRVLRTGDNGIYYTEHRLPDGEMHYYESIISSRVIEGKAVGLTISTRDITGRKQAEDALKESERRYRNLVDNAIVGIIQSTTKGEILFANQAVADMAGFDTPEEMLAEGALPRYSDPKQREEWIRRLRKDGRIDNFQTEMLDRCGNVRHGLHGAVMEGDVITTVTIDITDRVMADRELLRSQKELRNLTRKLESIREEERANIAREIHDELGQSMTALKMNLSWLRGKFQEDQKDLYDTVKSLEEIVDDNLQVVKRISSELRPTLLDDLGLAAAIEWHAGDFQTHTGIKCVLTLKLADLELDTDRSTTLYRIYQEAMTNIYRHADATEVRIRLGRGAENVILSVSDNGTGIKEEEVTNAHSLGIIGMKERVYHWDGRVDIRKKKRGTVVTITIPLDRGEK